MFELIKMMQCINADSLKCMISTYNIVYTKKFFNFPVLKTIIPEGKSYVRYSSN